MSANTEKDNRNRGQTDWPEGRRAALTVSFDDGYLGTIEASLPLLKERGLKATYSIITGAVGAKFEGLLTASWDRLQIMREQGHELACHSDRHVPMANWTAEIRKLRVGLANSPQPIIFLRQIVRTAHALTQQPKNPPLKGTRLVNDLKASKLDMERHLPGLLVSSFVYPTGRYNQASQHEVAAAGFSSARTALPGINQAYTNPFILRGLTWFPGAQIAEITPWLDLVLKRNGWLVVVFHYVGTESPGSYPYFCASQDFQRFLDQAGQRSLWIATQGEIARYIYEKNHSDGLKSEW
jgi:peptidoglycan/xylan/chitin deacetylase (PgdA/CDA1 family)